MWRIFVIAALISLAACSTQGAVKVRCDRHLVRINGPAPVAHHSVRESSPPAAGENR
jgi:hypothetical protein